MLLLRLAEALVSDDDLLLRGGVAAQDVAAAVPHLVALLPHVPHDQGLVLSDALQVGIQRLPDLFALLPALGPPINRAFSKVKPLGLEFEISATGADILKPKVFTVD